MIRPRRPSWIPRLKRLIFAAGWTQEQAARQFPGRIRGRPMGRGGLASILKGRVCPRPEFLERLAELEGLYAAEIEAIGRWIVRLPGGRRISFLKRRTERPPDLQALGAVGAENPLPQAPRSDPGAAPPTRGAVRADAARGSGDGGHCADPARQSARAGQAVGRESPVVSR